MADKMMRIAGRGLDGQAKAVQVNNSGSLITQINATAEVIDSDIRQSVGLGETLIVSGDVSGKVAKTAYVYAEKDGYAGIEVTLDGGGTWMPMIAARDEMIRDEFTGTDGDVLADWVVGRSGNYSDANSWAKIYSNKAKIKAVSTNLYSQTRIVHLTPVDFTSQKVLAFEVDETLFPSGAGLFEFKAQLLPSIPDDGVDTNSVARKTIFTIRDGAVRDYGSTVIPITSPQTDQQYRVVITSAVTEVYRGDTKVMTKETALGVPYYICFELVTHKNYGPLELNIDNVILWSSDASAKVTAKQLWVKTVSDAVPGDMRVVFQNDFDSVNTVTALLCGQS